MSSEDFKDKQESILLIWELRRNREKLWGQGPSEEKGTLHLVAITPPLKHTFIQGTKTPSLMHFTHVKCSSNIFHQIKKLD